VEKCEQLRVGKVSIQAANHWIHERKQFYVCCIRVNLYIP